MMAKRWMAAAVAALLMSSVCLLHAQDSQQPSGQQVQSAFPTKKIKATGTPQQAIPTQVMSDSIPDDDQASPEQIDEMMDVMRVDDQLENMMALLPLILQQQQKNLMQPYEPQMVKLSAAQKLQIEKLNKKYMDKADDVYPVADMVKDLAKLYRKRLNNGDVESLINFYTSEAGQHLMDVQPQIMSVFLPAMTVQLQKRVEALKDSEKKELDALMASFKSGSGKK
jgi:hypothetical protein